MVRFARSQLGLRAFFRDTLTTTEARRIIAGQMERRSANFVSMLERNVFGHPGSPYLPLFELAGIELGDVRNQVERSGLEGTLRSLRRAGVYVTFEEVKGRTPIIREGRELAPRGSFANPSIIPLHRSETGGSTGTATAVPSALDFHASAGAYQLLAWESRGWLGLPWALWRGVLPDGSGLHNVMRAARFGSIPERWFSPVIGRDQPRSAWRYRVETMAPLVMARTVGVKIPPPERVGLDQAPVVARWMGEALRRHGACILQAPVSRALRVALAARQLSIDLRGGYFRVAGEPLTPAKGAAIRASGAEVTTSYGSAEMGRIGFACGHQVGLNDVHLLSGHVALIQHDRPVLGSDIQVPAFLVTMLHPAAPFILINAESDDYGVVEQRSCPCPLGELGLDTHIGEIRSFQKLTGEGMTLVGSDIVYVLEEVLPARHGGSPLDYQLVEEEDDDGFTRYHIRVSPRIELPATDDVARTFTDALERMGDVSINALLEQGGMLRVERAEPEWTGRGKLMSLHINRPLQSGS